MNIDEVSKFLRCLIIEDVISAGRDASARHWRALLDVEMFVDFVNDDYPDLNREIVEPLINKIADDVMQERLPRHQQRDYIDAVNARLQLMEQEREALRNTPWARRQCRPSLLHAEGAT